MTRHWTTLVALPGQHLSISKNRFSAVPNKSVVPTLLGGLVGHGVQQLLNLSKSDVGQRQDGCLLRNICLMKGE